MGVINASASKASSVSYQPGIISRVIGWVEHLFGATPHTTLSGTPSAHGEDSRGNGGETEMTHDFGYDKTGGWDKGKKSGWSPHGDEGMK